MTVSAVIGSPNIRTSAGHKLSVVGTRSRISDCTSFRLSSIDEQRTALRAIGDVAVMFVAEDLGNYSIRPAMLSTTFTSKASYYIVGYGASDDDPRPGVKRMATIQGIACDAGADASYTCNPSFEFWGDGRQITGRTDRPDSCGGDSGGPVFEANALTPPSVIAVISRPVRGTTCGQGGVYVLLSPEIKTWVQAQLADRLSFLANGH